MPNSGDIDDPEGALPRLSLGQRLLAALPRLRHGGEKTPLVERFKEAVVKPVEPSAAAKAKAADVPMSIEELEETVRSADDKERLTGLLLAPVAAAIAIFISNLLLDSNPKKYLTSGALNPRYVSPATVHELSLVLLVLSLVMLGTAFFRKRFFLAAAMALYGLAVFNLHYWGFGVPYILVGAWLLVRTWRLHRDLREARAGGPVRPGARAGGRPATNTARPRPNKRYTPPTPAPRRSPPPKRKPEDQQKAV
jgi:hypothetical protein